MKKYREEMLNDLLALLSFDGEQHPPLAGAPFGQGNADCLNWTLELCKKLGFETKNLSGYAGVADLGEGEAFGILGHLDTVPVGEGWTKNPYGEISDGIIYGRGAMDDRGPMLACLYAVRALLDEGHVPKKKIRFIFGCNEESGWECIKYFNRVEKMPATGFSPDADFPVINCEKGIATLIFEKDFSAPIKISGGVRPNVVPDTCTAELPATPENIRFLENTKNATYKITDGKIYLTTKGKASHAAHPEQGENAIIKMLGLLSPLHPDFALLHAAYADTTGGGVGLNISDDISGALTLNLGTICSDDKLSYSLNIRYPVTTPETVIVNALDKALPYFIVTKSEFQKPLFVNKDDDLVKTLLSSYNEVTGDSLAPITIGGGTYARALAHGVAFGPEFPGRESTIHMPDERVSVDDFMLMAQIYKTAIKRLCF